ncbi:MAG TPA: hypothetical protein VIC04_10110 [Terriglobia bacterium]
MKKPNLTLSLAAGLLGGLLSHYALVAPSVHAQAQTPPEVVRAQSFVLMNERGEIGGVFRFDDQGRPVIQLFHDGREIARLGGRVIRPLDR